MSTASDLHHVFLINESDEAPIVEPKVLRVSPNDRVKFVVVADEGEDEEFTITLRSNVFRSISQDEEILAKQGAPPQGTVRPDISLSSIHRYEVASASEKEVDPIVFVYE